MTELRDFLVKNLPLIERTVASICRGKGMTEADIEDFTSEVKLRLIQNDCAILRAFEGRSSFGTYISAVIARLLVDHRNHEWGKWHASAEAQRLGETAMKLEQLLYREGHTLDEAYAALCWTDPKLTRKEFDTLATRLPQRPRRQRVALKEQIIEPQAPDTSVQERAMAAHISAVVRGFMEDLKEEDRLILQLRFDGEFSVPQIARSLHLDHVSLYRRLRHLFDGLRERLEAAGIGAADAAELVGTDAAFLDFAFTRPDGDKLESARTVSTYQAGKS